MNMVAHPRMMDRVEGIIVRHEFIINSKSRRLYVFGLTSTIGGVLMMETSSSYSILMCMIEMKKINIIAHMGEQVFGLKMRNA